MNRGSAFGRRSRPSASDFTGRLQLLRAAREAEAANEAPAVDPVHLAVRYSAIAAGALVAAAVALLLMLPSAEPNAESAGVASPQNTSTQILSGLSAIASKLAPNDGQPLTPAPQKASVRSSGAVGGTADDVQTAALKFFGFYHLNVRTRSAYCSSRGVDMSGFTDKFRQSQRATHAKASAVIASAGMTEEQVYANSRAELEGLIASDMEKIEQQAGLGANGACAVMVMHADMIVPGIDFAKVMPEVHRTLMGT